MHLKSRISHAAELKKLTYRILRNTRDLEGTKRTPRLLGAVYDGEPYVLRTISHLQRLMTSSLSGIGVSDVISRRDKYLAKLESVQRAAEECVRRGGTLQKGLMPDLLTLHTKLFNSILDKSIPIQVDLEEWSGFCLTAVSVWGDKV